jgi:hypothetical protein
LKLKIFKSSLTCRIEKAALLKIFKPKLSSKLELFLSLKCSNQA